MRRRSGSHSADIRLAVLLPSGVLLAWLLLPFLAVGARVPSAEETGGLAAQLPSGCSSSKLFKRSCVRCHGADGSGKDSRAKMPAIPDFTSARWQKERSTAHRVAAILEGRGTMMPAFAQKLSKEEARGLAEYIRAFGPAVATELPANDFEQRFRELQKEFDRLRKQFEDLRAVPK